MMNNLQYQRHMRNEINIIEELIKVYPNNKYLPVSRKFMLNELLYHQIQTFDRS